MPDASLTKETAAKLPVVKKYSTPDSGIIIMAWHNKLDKWCWAISQHVAGEEGGVFDSFEMLKNYNLQQKLADLHLPCTITLC